MSNLTYILFCADVCVIFRYRNGIYLLLVTSETFLLGRIDLYDTRPGIIGIILINKQALPQTLTFHF